MNLLYVISRFHYLARQIANMHQSDDHPPFDVPHCYGLFMDCIPNTCISIWYVNVVRPVAEHHGLTWKTGGIPPYIYGDIGGVDRWVWFVLANLLALAAVCPFVGALSDLIGRRYVAMIGAGFIVLGMIVCSTAQTMNIFICKCFRILHPQYSNC